MGAGHRQGLAESATFCFFAIPPFNAIWGSDEEVVRIFLNAVCGWNFTIQDVTDVKLRNYYFNRCVSLREGYNPANDDYLPPRAFDEPVTDKYGHIHVWDRKEFNTEKRRHYVDVLKLSENGLPLRDKLEKLGLDFVIPILMPKGLIG